MNCALLLAGGTGSRTGNQIPKQYISAHGHMMITYSLGALLSCQKIDCIFVVASQEWHSKIFSDAQNFNLDTQKIAGFANPGINRQESIKNGIKKILFFSQKTTFANTDTILIHEAARPFLSTNLLNSCYERLEGHDGVMPVISVKDTLYYSDNCLSLSKNLDREKIFAGQAPELFLLKSYWDANLALTYDELLKITGASQPAVMNGLDIAIIPGDENNIKITTEKDLSFFIDNIKGFFDYESMDS